jgi:hypothetical protein
VKDEVKHAMLLVKRHLEYLENYIDELETAIEVERARREEAGKPCPDYGGPEDYVK